MAQRVYRVCRSIHAKLDGEGAKLVGGRWNSPGQAVVYMAQSIALAVLENLVHMSEEDFPLKYVIVEALLPDDLDVTTEDDLNLRFGHLQVRSAVVPLEYNYLLNPAHRDFKRISVKRARPFRFDQRLLTDS